MSFYINFDEENIDLYHFSSNIASPYIGIANTLNNAMMFSVNRSEEAALSLAKGEVIPTYYNSEFITKIRNNVLINKFIPIQLEYKFTYQSTYSFNEFVNVTQNFNKPKLSEIPYPIAVRYVDENGCYYVERPPFQTEIDFTVNGRSKVNNCVKIWIPWTITVINPNYIQGTKVYFSDRQLSDMETEYVPSFLPNTYGDGSICFGNSLHGFLDSAHEDPSNLRYIYSTVFNEYMSGGWNIDLFPNVLNYALTAEKNSPVVKRFLDFTAEDLLKAYPNLRKSTAESIVKHDVRYSHDRLNIFKYMFYVMGTMSLEETLEFYREIIKNNNNIHKFSSITVKPSSTTNMGYGALSNKISKHCTGSYTARDSYFNFTLILENYENSLMDSSNGTLLSNSKTACDPASIQRILGECDISDIYSKVFEIVEEYSNKQIASGYQNIFVLDVANSSYTAHVVENDKIADFYYSNLFEKYCVPLNEYANQKIEVF